jgi:hypothetical protein
MADMRITNNSTLDTETIVGVERTGDGYRVTLRDGSAKRFRLVQLTPEGRAALDHLSQWGNA